VTDVPEVDAREAAARAASGEVLLLDVREPDEWHAGRAAGAVLVPLGQLDPAAVPTDRPVVVVCRSGNRSGTATAVLREAGVDAVNLAGGMRAWAAAGLPVTADNGTPGTVG
jgi:rhodanese-related sulfurtransferase